MKFETVRSHFLSDVFVLLWSENFATMATWRNDFSVLFVVYVFRILLASFLLSKLPACFICRYTRPLQRKPDFRKFQESGALESGIQLKESGIPLTIGIGNPSSIDKEPGFGAWKSGIHCAESRIQNYLGLPCMGQIHSHWCTNKLFGIKIHKFCTR